MADLAMWLCDNGSNPLLSVDLVSSLNVWHNSTELPNAHPWQQEQAKVGLDQFVDGWLALQWHKMQASFWTQICSWKSSKKSTIEISSNHGIQHGTCGKIGMVLFTTQSTTESAFWSTISMTKSWQYINWEARPCLVIPWGWFDTPWNINLLFPYLPSNNDLNLSRLQWLGNGNMILQLTWQSNSLCALGWSAITEPAPTKPFLVAQPYQPRWGGEMVWG